MARKKKGKVGKRKIFIFVEGETERLYFEFLRQKLRLSNIKTQTIILNNSGNNWIEKANNIMKNNKKFRRDNNTDVYIIFDNDNLTSTTLDAIKNRADRENITIGFSNRMFEVWLLAHFEIVTNGFLTNKVLTGKLSNYMKQNYIKANSNQLEKIVDLYSKAIENSESISAFDVNSQCTTVGTIVNKIVN